MTHFQLEDSNTLNDYAHKAVEYFVSMKDEDYIALLDRVGRLHVWIKGAQALRETYQNQ